MMANIFHKHVEIKNVTLGDEEASRRGVQKTVLERKGPSTFTRGAEIISKTEIQVHHNLESTVDALLAGRSPNYEVRKFDPNRSTYEMLPVKMEPSNELSPHVEEFVCVEENSLNNNEMISSSNSKFSLEFAETLAGRSADAGICIRIFVYGIAETSALQAIKQLGMDEAIGLTDNISEADAFLAMHSKLKKNSHIEAVAKSRGIPMHAIKTSSLMQLRKAVRTLINEHVRGFRKPEAEEVASTLQKADFSGAISELPVLKANASFTDKHGTGFEAPEFENKLRSLEEMDALEETRLAIEEVVIPKEEQVLLLPRSPTIISKQIKLIESYNLKWVTNGEDPHVSLCVLPFSLDKKEGKSYYVDYESEVNNLLGTYDNSNSQNEVARLPLLPE